MTILDQIVSWCVQQSYFIYKLDPQEEDTPFIYVVHFDKKMAELKVKDFCYGDSSCKTY